MGLKDQFMGPAMALLGNNASIDDLTNKLEQMRSIINKVSQHSPTGVVSKLAGSY